MAQAVDGAGAGRRGHGELPAALLHRPGQGQAQGQHQPEALHEHQLQLGGRGRQEVETGQLTNTSSSILNVRYIPCSGVHLQSLHPRPSVPVLFRQQTAGPNLDRDSHQRLQTEPILQQLRLGLHLPVPGLLDQEPRPQLQPPGHHQPRRPDGARDPGELRQEVAGGPVHPPDRVLQRQQGPATAARGAAQASQVIPGPEEESRVGGGEH